MIKYPDTFIPHDDIREPLFDRYYSSTFSYNKTDIEKGSERYWDLYYRIDYLMYRYIRRHNIAHTIPKDKIHLAALEKMFGIRRSKQDVMIFIIPYNS